MLNRLVTWRVLTTLDRRVGGVRAGSDGLIYTLDTAGTWLIRLDAAHTSSTPPRRPRQPATAFTSHILAVTELYVRLVEHSRIQPFEVTEFDAEPACWWPDSFGGHLKPDAYTLLSTHGYDDAWWIEVDQATETLPRLRKKLQSYLDFTHQGGIGPGGVTPRVLITTPTAKRCTAIKALSGGLQAPAEQLFHPVLHSSATDHLIIALLVDQ